MRADIAGATVKSLTYKAGTKEDDAEAGEIAALIGQTVEVALVSPQLAMPGLHVASITRDTVINAGRVGSDA